MSIVDFGKAAGQFGFIMDNTIGETPQPNDWMESWVEFYTERLRYQLDLAGDASLDRLSATLLPRVAEFFGDEEIRPSILHGDLWSGNMATAADGSPTIFDPACYYGHHVRVLPRSSPQCRKPSLACPGAPASRASSGKGTANSSQRCPS